MEEVDQATDNGMLNLILEQPQQNQPAQNEAQPMSGGVPDEDYVWYDPDLWIPTEELYMEYEELGYLNEEDTRQMIATSDRSNDSTENLLPPRPQAPEPIPPQRYSWIGTLMGGTKLGQAREDEKDKKSEKILDAIEAELILLNDLLAIIKGRKDDGDIQDGTRDTRDPHRGASEGATPEEKAKSLHTQLDDLVGVQLGSGWDHCAEARMAGLLEKVRLLRELVEAQHELDQIAHEARMCKKGSRFKLPEFNSDLFKARRAVAARRVWALKKKMARHEERLQGIPTVGFAHRRERGSRARRIWERILV
ncbi:hypothetical protein GGR58DRAFT_501706 [Xylaria digitata]|nr:hypothetical protein GGR58DRAFT_501706 [Xylaria digitata]